MKENHPEKNEKSASGKKRQLRPVPDEIDSEDEEFANEAAVDVHFGTNGNRANEQTGAAAVQETDASVPPTQEADREELAGSWFGWMALILAIASLFVWPVFLGPAAAVMGLFAYAQDQRTLGVWSIILGLISLVAYLFLLPYFS